MALRLMTAHECHNGSTILIDGEAYVVRSNDVSKTGKHGSSKCRIEAISVIDDKKKIVAVPGADRFEVPMIEKKKAQVLSVTDTMANVMDLENFETLDIPYVEELKGQLNPEDQVEYMIIDEKKKIIKRKISSG
jgi:translation initiation factor 5A